VRQITAEVGDLQLAPSSIDALFVMSYHDAYWRRRWSEPDRHGGGAQATQAALKPGGVVVVQDHVAKAGGDTAKVVDQLHRIDPAVVRAEFERAGFVFDRASEVLAHPDDDHTSSFSMSRSAARRTSSSTASKPIPKIWRAMAAVRLDNGTDGIRSG
jgi:predicted methyltransferase